MKLYKNFSVLSKIVKITKSFASVKETQYTVLSLTPKGMHINRITSLCMKPVQLVIQDKYCVNAIVPLEAYILYFWEETWFKSKNFWNKKEPLEKNITRVIQNI